MDVQEARQCGREAVRYAMERQSGSVAIRRIGSGKDYAVEYFCTELASVAEKTKSLPDQFINQQGNGITDAFLGYALPLTGGLPKTIYLGNHPRV